MIKYGQFAQGRAALLRLFVLPGILMALSVDLRAQNQAIGVVSGLVCAQADQQPVELAAVMLKRVADDVVVQSAVTDPRGEFVFEQVPVGEYQVAYGLVGTESKLSTLFRVTDDNHSIGLGKLVLGETVLQLEKMSVAGKQQEFYNTIDRKTYSVGREIQSATGTASDLLQNIPSVQVDLDGGVSLRGSDNVLILINGRTSTLMGKSRGEILQQLPADSIDKIEVITNPSAKYKPDGTAGIINITLKKKQEERASTITSFNVGTDDRYNAGVTATYNPGRYTLMGAYSIKQDDRSRTGTEVRTITNATTGEVTQVEKQTIESGRPLSQVVRGGFTYRPDDDSEWGVSGHYTHRADTRAALDHTVVSDGRGMVSQDYDRGQRRSDSEESVEGTAHYHREFSANGHELNVEFKSSRERELEPNRYRTVFRTPLKPTSEAHKFATNIESGTEVVVEYNRPLSETAKLESGYNFTDDRLDTDLFAEDLDVSTGQWIPNTIESNRFIHEGKVHAGYVTYARTIGRFGYLAGVRAEQAAVNSRLVTTGQMIPNDYFKVYPSLHLSYHLTEESELQLNYSHRIRRPESDELNPFIDYSDPLNLRAGNPLLRPEETHSVEAGYQFKQDKWTFISTVYHRSSYNSFTRVTRDLGNGVLLTTQENLGGNESTGLELVTTADIGSRLSVNFSSNTYFNTIDASNLGFSSSKSDVSWSAKMSANLKLGKNALMQFNTFYTSSRLTPQGSRLPSYVANLGLRQEFYQKKAAIILTISDLFNSYKESNRLDAPGLQGTNTRRRTARVIYVGMSYSFGKQTKKDKDDPMKFEDAPGAINGVRPLDATISHG